MKTGAKAVLTFAGVAVATLATSAGVLRAGGKRPRRMSLAQGMSPPGIAAPPNEASMTEAQLAGAAMDEGHRNAQQAEAALRNGNNVLALQLFRVAAQALGRANGLSRHLPSSEKPQLARLLDRVNALQQALVDEIGGFW
jgi:hypothetical protein